MNFSIKTLLFAVILLAGTSFGVYKFAFSSCCSATVATSGCTPSSCRGAKTKFGEAKVITDLRLNMIELKAEMEKSDSPQFEAESFDIHGIVGNSDEESLEILVKQLKVVEEEFSDKLNFNPTQFELPENSAKQVAYIDNRIDDLKELLKENA